MSVALLMAVGTPVFPQRWEIPFENRRVFGLFLVKVEANGRPAVLIVDTGASVTVISPELADVAPGTFDITAYPSKGSGFTGRGLFRRATLKVGPITWRDHKVVITDTRELSTPRTKSRRHAGHRLFQSV
jgi:predicted aspartyl protease